MVVWLYLKSKLKRPLIYHSASCYLLFLLHPLPTLGIMIKKRSSRISCSQRFLCAPSFALTSSNLLLTHSVKTIVVEVASGYHFFKKLILLLKLLIARAIYVNKSSFCFASAAVLSSLTVLRRRPRGSCQFNLQYSVQKLHLPKMGDQWVQVNVYTPAFHVALHSSTTHRPSCI